MNTPYVFKKCSKCGRWLVANTFNFSKSKTGKYGLDSWCKECKSAYNKKYHKENKEKIAEYYKKYNKENKGKLAEYYKKYRKEHKEEKREYDKKYYKENKGKLDEYYKKYIEENKEKRKNYMKKYNEENKEYHKKYNEENKEYLAEYRRKYNKTPQGQANILNAAHKRRQIEEQQGKGINGDQWLEMMKFFGFKCAYSGIPLKKGVNRTTDHIVPLAKGGAHEIWNCVPMDGSLNSSKNNKDIKEWYPQQDFYDEDRVDKINEWREYAYNKWGNKVNTKAI